MSKVKVLLDPRKRQRYLDKLLVLDGLSHIEEDTNAAYCPISLTQTPDELKLYLQKRQKILMTGVLKAAGIVAYDPASAPFSPDENLSSLPNEIYIVDSGKIVGSRFFVGHNLTASTGFGVELEKAKKFNRISVILFDKAIRISRMQPHRTIYLEYRNFEKQVDDFAKVFKLLKQYDPGMGFNGNVPALLGFKRRGSEVVDLEELVYTEFPHLQYKYNGDVPILQLRARNPELFYEYTA